MVDDFDVTHVPQSRVEAELDNMRGATNPIEIPQSRVEWLLKQILDGGGGHGGLVPTGSAGQYVGYNSGGSPLAINPDTEPVGGSNKLITSGGVAAALSLLPKGITYRGAVDYYVQLPVNAAEGDAYTVRYTGQSGTEPDGTEYARGMLNGSLQWIALGPDLTRILTLINTKADKLVEVTVATSGAVTQALDPNKLYHFTNNALTSLAVTLTAPASGDVAQYHFDFISGSTPATLTLPDTVFIDLDGTTGTGVMTYTMEANTRYELDILNGYGVISEWATN